MVLRRTEQAGGRALFVLMVGSAVWACGGAAFSVTSDTASGSTSGAASSGSGSAGHSGTAASGSHDGGGATGASGGSGAGSGDSGASGASSGGSATGSSAGATGSSGSATGSSGSAPDAGAPISCPTIEPNAGQECSNQGLECEYGPSPDIRCNQVAVCEAAGWTYAAASKCPAAMCPATYDEIVAGGHCGVAEETCAYPKGTCICSEDTGGPVRLVDASIVTDWACFASTLECPSPRRDLGEPCTDEGRKCDYGVCDGGVALQCLNGLWQEDLSASTCAQPN